MANKYEDDDLNELQDMMDKEFGKKDPSDMFVALLTEQAEESAGMAKGTYSQCMPANGEAPQHAWGKQQPEGSLQLPVEFEVVTMLGPVIIVCAPKGSHVPHLGTPRANTLVVYRDGFAYQAGGKEVKSWRFDEVAAIQTKLEDHSPTMVHEFTLFRTTGESLILDDSLHVVPAAADQIKLAVFKLLVAPFVQRYEAGEALAFGSITVQKQNGLQLGGHKYAWEDIQNIQVQFGEFKVALNNNKNSVVRTSEIPNIELLGRVIGLDQAEVGSGLLYISNVHY
jgi:hypothetical protein